MAPLTDALRRAAAAAERWPLTRPLALRARAYRAYRRTGVRRVAAGGRVRFESGPRVIVLTPAQAAVYGRDVQNHFDTFWQEVYPEPAAGGGEVVDFSEPRDHRVRPSGLTFRLNLFTEGENSVRDYLRHYRPAPGDVIIDGGANVGIAAYYFSREVGPTGRVFSFEPDPGNRACLEANVARHGLANVRVVPKALWSAETVLRFNSEGSLGSCLSDLVPRGGASRVIEVPATTVAAVCREHGVARPAFVKLDVESAEVEALKGVLDLTRLGPIHFAVACHQIGGVATTQAVVDLFHGAGYRTDVRRDVPMEDALVYASPPA